MGAWHLYPGSSTCNFVYYVSQILLIKNTVNHLSIAGTIR